MAIPGKYVPQEIYIDKEVAGLDFTKKILNRLPNIPRTIIVDPTHLVNHICSKPDPISTGTRSLLLSKQKGNLLSHVLAHLITLAVIIMF